MYEIGSNNWPGMAKVMEEAGELIKVMAKIMSGQGSTEYWDGTDLRINLMEELADLEAALWFFVTHNQERMEVEGEFFRPYNLRLRDKQDKFTEWQGQQQRSMQENERKWMELRDRFVREYGVSSGVIFIKDEPPGSLDQG